MAENGKIDTTAFFDIYDDVIENVEAAIAEGGRKRAIYQLTKDEINKAAQPFLVCEVLVPSYASKYEANKDDVEFLRKTVNMLDKQNCTDNSVYRNAARRLYDLAPDSTAALALAKMEHGLGKHTEAIQYLKDAAEAFKSAKMLETVYLIMADSYKELDRYSDSRNAASKALEYNPNNGNAYLLIGDLYANSASSCKYKDMIVAYWVAADAYAQAKSVDPSVADIASSKIGSMKARFPLKSDIFFRSLEVGSSFTVGCWINRSTTVRSSD
jgi:tetratricopeptide (TPR) repeat protein